MTTFNSSIYDLIRYNPSIQVKLQNNLSNFDDTISSRTRFDYFENIFENYNQTRYTCNSELYLNKLGVSVIKNVLKHNDKTCSINNIFKSKYVNLSFLSNKSYEGKFMNNVLFSREGKKKLSYQKLHIREKKSKIVVTVDKDKYEIKYTNDNVTITDSRTKLPLLSYNNGNDVTIYNDSIFNFDADSKTLSFKYLDLEVMLENYSFLNIFTIKMDNVKLSYGFMITVESPDMDIRYQKDIIHINDIKINNSFSYDNHCINMQLTVNNIVFYRKDCNFSLTLIENEFIKFWKDVIIVEGMLNVESKNFYIDKIDKITDMALSSAQYLYRFDINDNNEFLTLVSKYIRGYNEESNLVIDRWRYLNSHNLRDI